MPRGKRQKTVEQLPESTTRQQMEGEFQEVMSPAQQNILEAIDSEIAKLDKQLSPYQPLLNQLSQLRRTRQVLLSNHGGPGAASGTSNRISVDQIVAVVSSFGRPTSPKEVADKLNCNVATIRSQFSRHNGSRFRKEGNAWVTV